MNFIRDIDSGGATVGKMVGEKGRGGGGEGERGVSVPKLLVF